MKRLALTLGVVLVLVPQFTLAATYTWTSQTVPIPYYGSITSVASSADGMKLAATTCGWNISGTSPAGSILTSTDGGNTWTATSASSHCWTGVSSSNDGSKLAAYYSECSSSCNAYVYTSTDGGATWTQQSSAHGTTMYDITSSSDGSHIAASAEYNNTLFTTGNGGATWTSQPESTYWTSLASSADGTKIAAVSRAVAGSTGVVISTDGGSTWTAYSVPGYHPYSNEQDWVDVTMSSDGTAIAVAEQNGDIHTSTNGGVMWTDQSSAGSRFWMAITSSADGKTIAGILLNGSIYLSTDGGATWTVQQGTSGNGSQMSADIASSASGSRLVATDGSYMYVGIGAPTCTISISPNPVAYGSSATVTWSSTNANTSFYINHIGYIPPATVASGSTSVQPSSSTDYSGTAVGSGGTATCPATLTVTAPSPPTATITSSLGSSMQVGQSSTITATFTPSGGGQQVSSTPTVLYLTSGTNWSVPSDWNSSDNTIEVIGGGGAGGGASGYSGAGGGGGAYAKTANVSLAPSASVAYNIGAAGNIVSGQVHDGGDTYFCNSTANCSAITGSAVVVGAKGGLHGGGGGCNNGGTGGDAASSIGTVKYSGGRGGMFAPPGAPSCNGGTDTGAGGGGAAGPHGNGGNGVDPVSYPDGSAGGAGDAGFGGAGASCTYDGSGNAINCNGGSGSEWAASRGSGGGGSGSNNGGSVRSDGSYGGGNGGAYGGGGGGNDESGSDATNGNGSQGLMVITYYALTSGSGSDPLTADNIDSPLGTGLGANTNPTSPKSITFTPATSGSYTFYARATTGYFSSWTTYAQTTVNVTGSSCTLNGVTVPNNSSYTFYSQQTAPSGQLCSAYGQSRMCTNGTLSGSSSFQYASCSCTSSYSCSGQTIQHTDASCTVSNVTTCYLPTFCSAGSSTCLSPTITFTPSGGYTGHLQVVPTLVKQGSTVQVHWSVSNTPSCTVTGTNGDSWSGTSSPANGQTSSAIKGQTIYTLSCQGYGSNPGISESQTVNVAPSFQEQ